MSDATDIFRTRLESASEYELALAENLCEIIGGCQGAWVNAVSRFYQYIAK